MLHPSEKLQAAIPPSSPPSDRLSLLPSLVLPTPVGTPTTSPFDSCRYLLSAAPSSLARLLETPPAMPPHRHRPRTIRPVVEIYHSSPSPGRLHLLPAIPHGHPSMGTTPRSHHRCPPPAATPSSSLSPSSPWMLAKPTVVTTISAPRSLSSIADHPPATAHHAAGQRPAFTHITASRTTTISFPPAVGDLPWLPHPEDAIFQSSIPSLSSLA